MSRNLNCHLDHTYKNGVLKLLRVYTPFSMSFNCFALQNGSDPFTEKEEAFLDSKKASLFTYF
jgi:hypothetical protein